MNATETRCISCGIAFDPDVEPPVCRWCDRPYCDDCDDKHGDDGCPLRDIDGIRAERMGTGKAVRL